MIIDFHTHVFSPAVKKNRNKYIDSDPCFAILYSDPKAKLATAEELIASMDESIGNRAGFVAESLFCIRTRA